MARLATPNEMKAAQDIELETPSAQPNHKSLRFMSYYARHSRLSGRNRRARGF